MEFSVELAVVTNPVYLEGPTHSLPAMLVPNTVAGLPPWLKFELPVHNALGEDEHLAGGQVLGVEPIRI